MGGEESKIIWETIMKLPIGTVVGWGAVIMGIISVTYAGIIKVFKAFKHYDSIKRENKEQKEKILEHERLIGEVNESLAEIKSVLLSQKEASLHHLRYTIAQACDEAIRQGEISAGKLESLEELYGEYVDVFHGNGYIKTMMKKVRELPVIGSIVDD